MKITIPSNLNEINLHQYQEYHSYVDKLDAEQLAIKKIEIFCHLTRAQILQFQYSEVQRVSNILDEILNTKPQLIQKFNLGSQKFGWLPDLDKMSYGELLDVNANISDWENMHVAMAVLYRPIKSEIKAGLYNIEKYEGDKYHDVIKFMPLEAVISAMVFFWNLGTDCLKYTLQYMEQETKASKEAKTLLQQNGVGMQQLTNLLEEMSQSLKLSLN